ncbi:MAG: T9SS type A sorting domain-containing protein, partial [Bacteroidia bacterium]
AWGGNVTQIGWDWKTFDLATRSYIMDTDLAYFVRTQNGAVYKLWFTDYTVGTAIYSFNTKEIKAGTLSANKITKLNTSVYPNPTADVLNINNKENETLTISLLNVHGVVVLNSTVSANATQSISTTDLAKGVYFLQLSTANTSNTQRVIFE